MGQFKQEDVSGLVRNSDTTHTVVLKDGSRKVIDKETSSSLMNRLDKDRSRMEKEGSRREAQDPTKRTTATEVAQRDRQLRHDLSERFGKRR